jgi:hypothetical protein
MDRPLINFFFELSEWIADLTPNGSLRFFARPPLEAVKISLAGPPAETGFTGFPTRFTRFARFGTIHVG